jgi:transposase
MSESKQRQVHTPELKARFGLEAIRGIKTLNEIALEFGVHPVQVGQGKKEIQDHAKTLFEGKRDTKPVDELDLLHSRLIGEEYTLLILRQPQDGGVSQN